MWASGVVAELKHHEFGREKSLMQFYPEPPGKLLDSRMCTQQAECFLPLGHLCWGFSLAFQVQYGELFTVAGVLIWPFIVWRAQVCWEEICSTNFWKKQPKMLPEVDDLGQYWGVGLGEQLAQPLEIVLDG